MESLRMADCAMINESNIAHSPLNTYTCYYNGKGIYYGNRVEDNRHGVAKYGIRLEMRK
jgi:hypothetical protein